MEATMDEVGAALPTDEHTTESAVVPDVGTLPSPEQLIPEHVCMEDIGTQLINIESIQQTIRTHVWNLENKPTETTVFELKSLLPRLDGLQSSLRKTFAAHARPSIRKLHIFQLPDELLMKISENVRGDINIRAEKYSIAGIKGIKNLRLTFFEIMREDYQNDLDYLRDYASHFEPDPDIEASNHPSPDEYEFLCKSVNNLGKREQIIRSCTNFLRTETSESAEDHNMAILRQAYKVYERLFNNQITYLQNDTFVTTVAEAVARMPTVAGLSISDRLAFELRLPSTEMSGLIYDSVRESLLEPRLWSPKLVSLLPQRHAKLLYQLPLAFIRAGNPLTRLCIRLEPITDYELRLSEELVKDLVSAAEHLKVLEIDCQLLRAVQSGGQARLSKLVSLFLNGTNLRSVTLCFGHWQSIRLGERSSLESLLALLPWANLRRVSLVNGSFQYDELSKHLEKLVPGTYILLIGVHLQSGLWADLLDLLRAKADCESDVKSPTGVEDQKLGNSYHEYFTRTKTMWTHEGMEDED
ncbi:hypothetical protein LA080_014088 [Diaporthe eres]|nr:hypothetical protein LA080_014088 [Diaporthe eres]